METAERINVVYSLTRNLYPHLRGAIRSLLAHNRNVKIYIFAEDNELPFEIPCEHQILNMSDQTVFPPDNPNMRSQFTYMAMLRVCTAELIPEDKIIQLDIDTLVCDSLTPIWELDLTGKWLAWCPEYLGHWRPYERTYYNFGVAVLNLAQLRRDNVAEFMVKELNSFPYRFLDQDVMNRYAVPDRCVDLPVRFNECFCCGQTDSPAIVHYAGYPDWYKNQSVPRSEYLELYRNEAEDD